jgi:hypothetical protein
VIGMDWGDVKRSTTAELIAQRTNLASFVALATVRQRLMEIQRELDERTAPRQEVKS